MIFNISKAIKENRLFMPQSLLESNRQSMAMISITGISGGTGASTTARLLSKHLELPVISGGKYFRALANRFSYFQEQNSDLSVEMQYKAFLKRYEQVFIEKGLDGASELIQKGIAEGANGKMLSTFIAEIEKSMKKKGQIDKTWDYIVDQKVISVALEKSGFILESKLAVISLKLDQLQDIISKYPTFTLPYLNVLLSLKPEVAAERISQRENRPVNADDILLRKQRDFDRYGDLYQIDGQRVEHSDLYKFTDIIIDTENLKPEEVAITVLNAYIQKVASLGLLKEPASLTAVRNVKQAIKQLQAKT